MSDAKLAKTDSFQNFTRRQALIAGAATAGGALLFSDLRARGGETGGAAPAEPRPTSADQPLAPGIPGMDYNPVIIPNGAKLPWKIVDGVKVFHMVAEELWHEFIPPADGTDGLRAKVWGYNGVCHGPAIEAVEGDRVRIYVTNRLAAATTVHWHGVLVPSGMDGVGGLNQKAIAPGETFAYEFTLRQNGTCMYHAHHDEMTQIGLGMTGLFIIHPRNLPRAQWPDRDFALMLHEWRLNPGATRPDPNEMVEFNLLTINAKAFPGTEPLVAKVGDKVRVRFGNLSPMDHHPMHLHGYRFKITETDGGKIPESAQQVDSTVLVPVGSTRTIEFVADEPGDWAMHCHMTHHVMNQMGHGTPNMIGVDPGNLDQRIRGQTATADGAQHPLLPTYMTMGQSGMAEMGEMGMKMPPNSAPMIGGRGAHDYITMGGMFTIFKVRRDLSGYADPGWYEAPADMIAVAAGSDRLRRDGIDQSGHPGIEPAGVTSPSGLGHFRDENRPGLYQVTAPGVAPVVLDDGSGGPKPQGASITTQPASGGELSYTCPMHSDVSADKPGKCPKCGMNLVPKK